MTEAPVPSLSRSQRQTLQQIAGGDFVPVDLDWVAVQRLKKMGLIEERVGGTVVTKEGQRVLANLTLGSR